MTKITIEDVNKYITMIRINFENAYKTQNIEEREMLLASWYAILQEYPKEICDKAVINAIKNAEFAPRIGNIVKEIEKMQEAFEKTDHELWAELISKFREVRRFASRINNNFVESNGLTQGENARQILEEIFDELSPELKDYCRNSRGLIELAQYTEEQLSFERGRFIKTMPQLRARKKMREQTPVNLAGLIQGISIKLIDNAI